MGNELQKNSYSLSSKYSYPHPPAAVSWCACEVASFVSDSLWPQGLLAAKVLCRWDFPGKNTGVGCYFFLQRSFLTQGQNPSLLPLLHWQSCSLLLVPPEKPCKPASLKCRKLRVMPVCSPSPQSYLGLSCKAIGSTFLHWCTPY